MFQPEGFSKDIFTSRYAFTEEETWEEACSRLARQNVLAEVPEKQKDYEEKINSILVNNLFVPGGRIWYNSGRSNPQLLNCFVLNNELDSKSGWGNLAKEMVITSMTGGGCGIDFSDIRPNGAKVGSGGFCPGPVSAMKMIDGCAEPVKSGGGRRVALMFSLDLDHPDVMEFLDAKLEKGQLTHANISVRSHRTTEFIKAVKNDEDWELSWKGQYKKVIKAGDLWNKIVKNAHTSAEPGFLNWELIEIENNIGYIEKLVTTNPCVTGDTLILTDNGYNSIESLVDTEVNIWNGFEWSKVTPKITGFNQKILKIKFSDGRELKCTPYHKFHLAEGYTGNFKIVEACELKLNDKLIKHEFPLLDNKREATFNAYAQGFKSAEGMDDYNFLWLYEPKYMCSQRLKNVKELKNKKTAVKVDAPFPKNYVPFDLGLKDQLNWLAGLFDGDGTELKEGGLQLVSIDFNFLRNLQNLLSILGIQTKVVPAMPEGYRYMPDGQGGSKEYFCQESKRICIGATQMQTLKSLGLKCERMSFDKEPQRDASQFVRVISIEEFGESEIVYCFNEPKRHLGIFNGIITGQCGEIALSAYDCCCLGHLVLPKFIEGEDLDWHKLANTVRLGIRFLDNVLTVNHYPLPEMRAKSHKLRRIGMGTTGLADLLALLGLRYGSTEGNKFIDKLYRFIAKTAYESSVMLAVEKGPFPACDRKKHLESGFMKRMPKKIRSLVEEHGIRNCAILTQAPTGTVSILSGNCSSGIEPMFSPAYERRFWVGEERKIETVFHPLFAKFMQEGKSVDHFVGSHDLKVEEHMEVQKIVQKHVDNAVSKTINMPENYTVEDMSDIWLKYLPSLKGTTFYRENSRGFFNEKTQMIEEPPLKPISLEEAKKYFTSQSKTDIIPVDDCISGSCEL